MELKKWYTSKTLWVNLIAVAAGIIGGDALSPEMQVGILAVINMVLRAVTNTGITT